jgi:iron complex transport system permease protein
MTRTILALALAILALAAIGLSHGDYPVPIAEVIDALSGDAGTPPQVAMIVVELRLPRLVLGCLVGIALAIAGAIAQAVMRNPLAEPALLGINSGAALAAMILIVGVRGAPEYLLPATSFAGAAGMALAIYILSWRHGTSSLRIILIGIGLSSLASAATTFLAAFGDIRDVQRAMVWLAGTVYDSSWAKVQTLFAWMVLPVALTWMAARELDTIAFGDMTARSLGQRVNLIHGLMILMCMLLSGAAVAAAGLVGFVGLVAPHLARRLVGHSHVRLIPTAALTGGLMVMGADFVGRTIIAPAQLPAGLMTALLGAPFFAWLMWERRHVAAA